MDAAESDITGMIMSIALLQMKTQCGQQYLLCWNSGRRPQAQPSCLDRLHRCNWRFASTCTNQSLQEVMMHTSSACIKEEMDLELLGIDPATWPAMTFHYDDFVLKSVQLTSCCQSCKSLKHKHHTASRCCLAMVLCSDAMLLVAVRSE